MVFNRFNHRLMLVRGLGDLHPPRPADGRVGNVAIAADFVACIYDDHPLLLGENTSHLAQHGRLAHTGTAKQEDAVTLGHNILNHVNGAINGTADAQRQANHLPTPVPNTGDTVERAGNTGSVVVVKVANAADDHLNFGMADFGLAQNLFPAHVTRGWRPSQIHYNFDEVIFVTQFLDALTNGLRENRKERS
jgi:hypothetical protein